MYLVIYNKNLEWIYELFSLRMAVLLHKWEFKNIEVEFLKVSEKVWSPGLPDIGARKSWDFLILTVSASTAFYDSKGCTVSLCRKYRLWSDRANMVADLSLCWVHRSEDMMRNAQKRVLMQFADNAGPDQPAHKCRLTWVFIACLQNQWIL